MFSDEAHALGQHDAEAIEKRGLGGVGLGDATQADLAVCCGRQDDVVGLDAGKLFEDGARRVAEARARLPHLEALPQHEGEEADEDVGLDAILALMPDRAEVQLILLDAKSRLGLSELDVGLPELSVAPIGDVRAQQIGAFRQRGPIVERRRCDRRAGESPPGSRPVSKRDRRSGRRRAGFAAGCGRSGDSLCAASSGFLRARDASGEAFERRLDPPTELLVHRLLFAAPVGRAAQDHRLVGLGMARELDLDAFAHRAPAVRRASSERTSSAPTSARR